MLPHAGSMVLLDSVGAWDTDRIICHARSHLDPANPLRHAGRLATICAAEYGLQAAALHGALLAGGVAQQAGYVARLRDVRLHADRLDDPAHGTLAVLARLEAGQASGMIYAIAVHDQAGRPLLEARAAIALPA